MSLVSEGNPTFVKDFKSVDAAVNAVAIMCSARDFGYTNKEILELDFFMALFSQDFLDKVNKSANSTHLLEIRLKNIARDLRKIDKKCLLDSRWLPAKEYFDGLKRA
jgi:hypothetical protein